jgi:hypothetical protein
MNFHGIYKRAERVVHDNSPTILAAVGVSGTIATAVLASVASFKAALVIRDHEDRHNVALEPRERVKERIQLVWKLYVPSAVTGTITVVAIVAATRSGNRRTAAIAAAYSISERAFDEYRQEVIEKFGEHKERELRDELAQRRVLENPPGQIIMGGGSVLCHEAYSGRYFQSDMEALKRAQNDLNHRMFRSTHAYLSDFYDLVGLPYTSLSNHVGWEVEKLLELRFTSVLTPEGRPCLSFEYNYICEL